VSLATVDPFSLEPEPGRALAWRAGARLIHRSNIFWVLGSLVLLVGGVAGVLIQVVPSWRHLYLDQNLLATFRPPFSSGHILGTDNLGRDMFWQLVGGLGISLSIGIGVSLISVVLGLLIGIFGGFFGQVADAVTNVVVDVTWAFPAILLAVVFAGWIGPSLTTVILALALTNWAGFARIVRGEVLSLRERDFVSAARVLGVPKVIISARHFVVNLLPVTMVMTVYFIATSIIGEAGLSFLGLGVQAPTPSLGLILTVGRDYLAISPWMVVLPGVLLAIGVLFLNALGDRLRDLLDPFGRIQKR
jgi:ABC-type dipeptide/oligopeptide/nickel transport system permease subunit